MYGVPQGSVLGTLLISLSFFAPIEEVVFAHNFKAMMYAGDTQLYVTINSADDCPAVLI